MITIEGKDRLPHERIAFLQQTQLAILNILEDFDGEREQMVRTQRASLNILDDFNEERERMEQTQYASLNILEDFNSEKFKLENVRRAVINILDDLNKSNEELQKSRDMLEVRVIERTSELQSRTAELEVVNRSLEASNKELESFSYSVSHDLRAPLRTMDGFSLVLMEDYGDKLEPEAKEYLRFIRSSAQLMGQLIDDILNLSRISRAEIHPIKLDLSDLAREVVEELLRADPKRKVDVVIAPGLTGYGDRPLLKLVLENLIGNALKFTSKQANAKIEFGSTILDGAVVYFVRDNGVGFDINYVQKLFKPFQRLHRPEEFAGTGIGLASVYRIITRLGGKVWAEGKVNQGATFLFTLPEAKES